LLLKTLILRYKTYERANGEWEDGHPAAGHKLGQTGRCHHNILGLGMEKYLILLKIMNDDYLCPHLAKKKNVVDKRSIIAFQMMPRVKFVLQSGFNLIPHTP
jgi:hypothetical protein